MTKIVSIGLGVFFSIALARAIGPEGRGAYAVAIMISALGVQFCNFGLPISNTYFIGTNRSVVSTVVGNSIMLSFTVGGLAAILIGLIAWLWPQLFAINGLLVTMAVAMIPMGLLYMLFQNLLLALGKITEYNFLEVGGKLTLALGVVVFAATSISTELIYGLGFLVVLISSSVAGYWVIKSIDGHPTISFGMLKNHIKFGFKAYFVCLVAFLLLKIDFFIIQYYLSLEQMGHYAIATNISEIVFIFPAVVGSILYPKLCEIREDAEKWEVARLGMIAVGTVLGLCLIIVSFTVRPVIVCFLGDSFAPAETPAIVLSIAMFFYGINNILSIYVTSIGLPWYGIFAWLVGLATNIFANIIAIPQYGIVGAAWVSVASYALVFIIQYICIHERSIKLNAS